MRSEEMMASDLILEQETQTTALDIHQGDVGNTQDSQNDTSKLSSSSDLKRSYSASWLDVHEQRAKRITPSRDHHEPQEHEKDDHFSGSEQMLKLVHSMVSHNFDNVLDGKSIDGDVVQQAMLLTKDGGESSALKQNLKNPSFFDQPDHHNALVEKMTAEIIQFVSKGKVPELARQLIAASEEQDTSHRSQLVAVQTDLTYLRHIVHQQAFNLQTTMLTMFSEAGKWRQFYDKLKASNCRLQDENKELLADEMARSRATRSRTWREDMDAREG
mmetsp:Transcript_40394/g.56866  ORF Transcript_40394/g.56866 Transcript_40394/m.56866 type:complete len:273 (+) Transcript_40394:145-963(+)